MGGAKRDWLNYVAQQEVNERLAEFERNLKESRASDLAHSVKVTPAVKIDTNSLKEKT
jgi:hypothetical protein